jgi:hypothetical protein
MKLNSFFAIIAAASMGATLIGQANAQTPSTSSDPAVAAPDRPHSASTSGSGTATSGGKDANGDNGRDAMSDPKRPKATTDDSTDTQQNKPAQSQNR